MSSSTDCKSDKFLEKLSKRGMKPFCQRQLGVRLRDKSCLAPASGLEMGKKSIDVGLEAGRTWGQNSFQIKMAGFRERERFFSDWTFLKVP